MGRKTYNRHQLPPCPDTDSYVLVKTKEGYYWRKKRGTIRKASLNAILRRNAATSKISGPAASRILRKLEPFTRGLKMGRMTLKIAGLLMKTYHAKGIIDFSLLEGLELNAGHPLEKLYCGKYIVKENEQQVIIELETGRVRSQNKLVTDYYFDFVLLYGDPTTDKTLNTESRTSALFSFSDKEVQNIKLNLPIITKPWMLLLKISCLEGNELAMHPRHYGMKVVRTGNVTG